MDDENLEPTEITEFPKVVSKHLIGYRESAEAEWKKVYALMYETNEPLDLNNDLVKYLRETYGEENVMFEELPLEDSDQEKCDMLYQGIEWPKEDLDEE